MNIRKILRRLLPLIPAAAGLLCLGVCRLFPAVAEWVFARGVRRGLSALLGTVTGFLPFSLAELLVVTALPAAVALVVWAVRRPAVRAKLLRGCAWCVSSAFLLYLLMHGLQYARLPLSEQMGLSVSHSSSVERLADLTAYFAEKASAARAECKEDAQGCMRLSTTTGEVLKSGGEGYARLAEQYPELKADAQFLDLQRQLQSIENDIAQARKYYSGSVKQYNQKVRMFPSSIVAGMSGFKTAPYFEIADDAERTAPTVDFSK